MVPYIRDEKTWGVTKLCVPIPPCARKRAWSYLVVGQRLTWFNKHREDFYWCQWHCYTCRKAAVNSVVVLTTLEFLLVILSYLQFGLIPSRSWLLVIIDYLHCHSCFYTEGWKSWFGTSWENYLHFKKNHQLSHKPGNIAKFSIGGISKT